MGETTEVQVSTYNPIGTFVGVTHGNSPKIGAEGADSTFHYIALVPNMSIYRHWRDDSHAVLSAQADKKVRRQHA